MNYYKITQIPKNKYIIGYEINNDIIIIKFANNETYVVKNTVNNENKILERINKQVVLITKSKVNNRLINYIIVYYAGTITALTLIFRALAIVIMLISTSFSIFDILLASFNLIMALCIFNGIRLFNKEDKNLKKIKLYCETKELLNNSNKKSGINVLKKVPFMSIKKISDKNIDEELFTINAINKLSLKDLQLFKDNIEREKEFDLGEKKIAYKTRAKRKN